MKKVTCVVVGGLIFLVAIYANSFAQTPLTENYLEIMSSESQIPTDSCIAVPGDLNGDYKVNLSDVSLYSSCMSGVVLLFNLPAGMILTVMDYYFRWQI